MNTLRDVFDRQAGNAGAPELDIDDLVGLGEQRLRRRRLTALAGAGIALVLTITFAIGGAALMDLSRSTDPIDTPSPTRSPTPAPSPTQAEQPRGTLHPAKGTKRLSPRQTVQSYNAQLVSAMTSFDDPDVRVSVWRATCLVCPGLGWGRGPRNFNAIAVTDDGYRTATYLPGPNQVGVDSILSVSPDTFLLNEGGDEQKLLSADGTLRRVRMVNEARSPDDPRLVNRCGGDDDGPGVGWCVLDISTATEARLPLTFTVTGRSAGNPALGQRAWGSESMSLPPYRAWWNDGEIRRTGDLAYPFQPVPSVLRGEDTPTYVRWPMWSHRLDVFQVRDRASGLTLVGSRPWLSLTRAQIAEPGHPKEIGINVEYARMPDGGLLAWSTSWSTSPTGLTVWRAASLTSGEFEVVYEGPPGSDWSLAGYRSQVAFHDGSIYLDRLVSEDDGRTWTDQATTWR